VKSRPYPSFLFFAFFFHAFVRDSGLYEVQITMLTPFPGTPLYQQLLREERIIEPGNWDLCTLFDINLRPRGMTPGQLQQGFLKLAKNLYSEQETNHRRRSFRQMWKEKCRSTAA